MATLRAAEIKLSQGIGRNLVKLAIVRVAKNAILDKGSKEDRILGAREVLKNPSWFLDRIYPLVIDDIDENSDDSTIMIKVKEALLLFEE